MDFSGDEPFWLLLSAVAVGAYLLGRVTAGGSLEDRTDQRMRERREAEDAFSNLAPTAQQEIDALLAEGKTIEAIKRFRAESGLGLKPSKDAIDYRRRTMGKV